jgi:GR25 family glycosyltransferase involved in LPS biosynthesis
MKSALKKLRPLAWSLEDNWAIFTYARWSLITGDLNDALEMAAHALTRFPNDKKILSLIYLRKFFEGNISYYIHYNDPTINKTLSTELNTKILFMCGEFRKLRIFVENSEDVSSKSKELYVRAGHAETLANQQPPNLDVDIYVLGPLQESPRLKRFAHSCSPLGLDFHVVENFDGAKLPIQIHQRLFTRFQEITHPYKSLGSFISHARAWNEIVASGKPGGIVCEDDNIFIYNPKFALEAASYDQSEKVIFLNDRISNRDFMSGYKSITESDAKKNYLSARRTIGADCYYMPRSIAKIALDIVKNDGFESVVDLFLLDHLPTHAGAQATSIDPAPGEHADEEYMLGSI